MAITMDGTVSLTHQDVVKEVPLILVSSNNPSPVEKVFLSNIDQALSFNVETVYFFGVTPSRSSSTLDVSDRLKKAVADTLLVPYYFMAGRLNVNEKTCRLELLCNNSGVLFVSATSRLELKELGNLSLPNPSFHHFIHRPGLYKSLAETALLTIQVTRFACGGFSIGIVAHHAILDGKGASEMLENLASICRGEGLKAKHINNDRTCLRARNPPIIKYPHKEYVKNRHLISSLPSSFTVPGQAFPSRLIFSKSYIHKVFYFSPERINALKGKAMTHCSSFEAIVAHVWKARTKAVFSNLNDHTTVLFAADIRSKISPTLPDGFAGNAVITAFATTKVADLLNMPLSFPVGKIKKGRERVTNEYIRSAIDWLEVHKGIPAALNGNFYVSAWWKLPFHELDFGFGKPIHQGPVVFGNDQFVLLLPEGNSVNNEGGINLWIGLEQEKMERFMIHMLEI